jgi:hypothetical protein
MSNNYLPETPAAFPLTCGYCYPDLDPATYVHQPCGAHVPDMSGTDDAKVEVQHFTGNMEAGGLGNQAVCEQIHQGRRS